MGSPLNIQPQGLLEFFGVKDGGWGPRELLGQLQPDLDLWRHYVVANPVHFDGTIVQIAGAAAGTTLNDIAWTYPITPAGGLTPNPVPQNELWYLDTMTLHATLSAGAGSSLSMLTLSESNISPGAFCLLPFSPVSLVSNATGVSTCFTSLQYPVFIRGGSLLQAFSSYVVAATETLDIRVTGRGVRMRI